MTVAEIDRAYQECLELAAARTPPTATAVAILRFLSEVLAKLHVGRAFYFDQLVPVLRDVFEGLPDGELDPEIVAVISGALNAIHSDRWFVGAGGGAVLVAWDRVTARPFSASPNPGGISSGSDPGASIPVVHRVGAIRADAGAIVVGSVLRVCLRVLPRGRGRPGVHWSGAVAPGGGPDMRSLSHVVEDAYHAALQVVGARASRVSRTIAFELTLGDTAPLLAGDSIGLAIAALILGAFRGLDGRSKGWGPSDRVAWTGSVSPDGSVGAVDVGSLRAKVRAVWFSGHGGLVFPDDQRELVMAAVTELQGRSSHGHVRPFELFGIHHLRDLEAITTIRQPRRLKNPNTDRRRLALFTIAVSAGVFAAYALLLSAQEPRRVDPLSPRLEPSERHLTIPYRIGPPQSLARDAEIRFAAVADSLEGFPPRDRLLVLVTGASDREPSAIEFVSLPALATVFRYVFRESGLPVDPQWSRPDGFYDCKAAILLDVDNDGRRELAIACAHNPYSTTVISLLDGPSTPSGAVLHPGHVEQVAQVDLTGGPGAELICGGYHRAVGGVDVVILSASDFAPTRFESRGGTSFVRDWSLARQRCQAHIVIPMISKLPSVQSLEGLGVVDLSLAPRPAGPPIIRLSVLANADNYQHGDYLVSIRFPPGEARVIANATMAERAGRWLTEGRTRIDFASDSTLNSWRRSWTVSDHIEWGHPSGRPLAALR